MKSLSMCAVVALTLLALTTPLDAQIIDGTFEAGNPWNAWTTQTSFNFGTPLCDVANCGTGGGTAEPFGGTGNWCWFGGIAAAETGSIGQSAVIAVGTTAIEFQARWGVVVAPNTSVMTVSIDGTTIGTLNEPAADEGAYSLRSFAIPGSFADGNAHAILFSYSQTTTQTVNLVIDNIELVGTSTGGTIDIQTTTLPDAIEQVAYSTSVTATETGTTGPYTWTLTNNPTWLSISGTSLTATLSGTPPAASAGTINFDVTVTATSSETDTQNLSLTILPSGTLAIVTTTMPSGTVGQAYTATIDCTGGTGPYTWNIVAGSLPAGMALDGSTTTSVGFTGNPSTATTANFTIEVTDSAAASDLQALSLTINTSGGGGGTGGGGGGGGGGGCAANPATGIVAMGVLLLFAAGARRRRAA